MNRSALLLDRVLGGYVDHFMRALLADAMRYRKATSTKRQAILHRMKRLVKSRELERSDVQVAVGKELMPLLYQ